MSFRAALRVEEDEAEIMKRNGNRTLHQMEQLELGKCT